MGRTTPASSITGASRLASGQFIQNTPLDDTIANLRDFTKENGKSDLLYWDPPWNYGDRGPEGSKEWAIDPSRHYPLIPDTQLRELTRTAVKECCQYNAVMALWAPVSQIGLAVDLIRDAGFEPTSTLVWHKIHETGRSASCMSNGTVRPSSELLILAKRGGGLSLRPNASQLNSVFIANRGAHSAKPEIARTWLEQAYKSKQRLELFSRTPRPGWQVWGNQAHTTPLTLAA